mgnify:CR=1 FL=1
MQKNQKDIKVIVNQKKLSSAEISMKQDFDAILKKFHQQKKMWKNPWFFGPVGISVLLLFYIVI